MRKFNPFRIESLMVLLLVALCATTYQCISYIFISFFKLSPPVHRAFQVQEWNMPLSDKNGFTGIRLLMVDDLVAHYDFHGWNQRELSALLGEPLKRRDTTPPRQVQYDLRDGLNLLIFTMDEDGRAVSYQIRRED